MRVAAVDIGTNTVRYLVGDVSDGSLHPVAHGRAITRLGQGVDRDKRLHPDAVERTLDAIVVSVDGARAAGAERIRVIGTSALRDAADSEEFVRAVHERTGEILEVIAGDEEGRLSLLGATSGLPDGDYIVCDIGGGSTELSSRAGAVSLDIGSVRLKERCLPGDPPTHEEILAARRVIDAALSDPRLTGVDNRPSAPDIHSSGATDRGGGSTLVGVAGTVTTVAAVVLELQAYDRDRVHHARLSREAVRTTSERLLSMRADDIAATGPVERGRADVIGGGSLILVAVMERFGFDEVLVSESDILDGLVLDLASNR